MSIVKHLKGKRIEMHFNNWLYFGVLMAQGCIPYGLAIAKLFFLSQFNIQNSFMNQQKSIQTDTTCVHHPMCKLAICSLIINPSEQLTEWTDHKGITQLETFTIFPNDFIF